MVRRGRKAIERKRRSFADWIAIAETLQVGRADIMVDVHANHRARMRGSLRSMQASSRKRATASLRNEPASRSDDLETRSIVSYVYSIDPTTEPLCLVYTIDDGDPALRLPTDPPPGGL